ncbi:NAD(P)-dependent oxidoreductase [Reyranella sp. CPCC 100927]|uniref:NAD(P)-dependent oxidoreductase n=1 Tax=Reyranella sp. CPCC 100927 TaxID=2599616 RepID=UPI0011B6D6DE|nr:NAD(P)-dependent oxidoreductase [Reyranella sp. CPCC 100927]TWT03946.1 2-hydroxyacid dehydrogenase [Reyranella sp. CPCC 100927]
MQTNDRPGILLGFGFARATRDAFGAAFDIVGSIPRPDPDLVTADMAARTRALVTVGSIGASDALMAALPHASIICCFGTGFERIDLAAARRRNIAVTHSPDVNAADVADMAMALLLASTRHVAQADRFIRAGKWDARLSGRFGPVAGLGGGKLGILGLGAIGTRVATRAAAFEMTIGYHNRRQRNDVPYAYFETPLALAQWADYVVVACRADDTNRHLVNAEFLRALGPRGHLVNVSRGSVVDEAALAEALVAHVIEGAGLDVFEQEPPVHPRLPTVESVVMTPHLGGGTERALRGMTDLVLRNLQAHFAGESPITPVPQEQ